MLQRGSTLVEKIVSQLFGRASLGNLTKPE